MSVPDPLKQGNLTTSSVKEHFGVPKLEQLCHQLHTDIAGQGQVDVFHHRG